MTSVPFVNFKMAPSKDVGSSPVLVFGSQKTCLIDSILLVNPSETPVLISLYLLRESSSPQGGTPTGQAEEYPLASSFPLSPQGRADLLERLALTLEAEDTLHAYSDDASHLFNVFVSYRELNELTPSPTPGGSYV